MSDQNGSGGSKPRLLERLRGLFGLTGASTRHDIKGALDDSEQDGDISPRERTMLKNVLDLHEIRVADVMVTRADIISVSLDESLAEVLITFRSAGHSRLPVHGETLDDPRGMVHIRDFVDYIATAAETNPTRKRQRVYTLSSVLISENPSKVLQTTAQRNGIDLSITLEQADILRPVLFAPPSMPALDLLVKMQTMRTHMALVIDEYGGTEGLVSIEDIVEIIVGDIEDEHDEDESPKISQVSGQTWLVNARALLEDLTAETKIDFNQFEGAEDIDTLGGLISVLTGRVPIRGEIIRAGDKIELEILDADLRRIKRVRLHINNDENNGDSTKNEEKK